MSEKCRDYKGTEIEVGSIVTVIGSCRLTNECFSMTDVMESFKKNGLSYTVERVEPEKDLVLFCGYIWHCKDLSVVLDNDEVEDPEPFNFYFDEKCLDI
jgi:hypothetical protein